MLRVIDHNKMGKSERGWLHSIFHFSFAEYYNPNNMNYGALRVVNDDIIEPSGGFDTHPHQNMEIISYVVDGVLTHKDSMGNQHELTRGQVQYMSAGTGVTHSEFNHTKQPARFLQIWILPDKSGYQPNYGDYRFEWAEREGRWLHIASGVGGGAPIEIHQNMMVFAASVSAGQELSYPLEVGRQAYIIQIEGDGELNGHAFAARDAAELAEEGVTLRAKTDSHYILFDMPEDTI